MDADKQYRLEDFRQSIPLQKAQSQARALVPITEADTEQEDHSNSYVATTNYEQKSQSMLIPTSSGV